MLTSRTWVNLKHMAPTRTGAGTMFSGPSSKAGHGDAAVWASVAELTSSLARPVQASVAQVLVQRRAIVVACVHLHQTWPRVCARCVCHTQDKVRVAKTQPWAAWPQIRRRTCNGIRKAAWSPYTGKIDLSKMAVGNAKVAQAFGMSTTPLIRPSIGAQDRSKYACSPVKPNFFRYSIALRQARR